MDRGSLLYGDAIVFRYNNNQSGHTYIYLAGDGWGEHEVYEARGPTTARAPLPHRLQ